VTPLSGQPGKEILVLGKLHLQTPLMRAGAFREDIQYQRYPVDDLDIKLFLQVILLFRRQLIIEDKNVKVFGAF
jgi:hypothetical protein